jgi:hypothetical protein
MGPFEAAVTGASIATGCFMHCGHYSRRRFPISLWSKKYPLTRVLLWAVIVLWVLSKSSFNCENCALSVCNSPKRTALNLVGGLGLKWCALREGQVLGCCERCNELSQFIKYGLSLTTWRTIFTHQLNALVSYIIKSLKRFIHLTAPTCFDT